MSRARSSAYWSANRYADEAAEPPALAPLQDLPAAAAARFKALRTGLLALDGVAETVRYMGVTWRWAWEYGVGNRKLCWVHVVGDALAATFTMSDAEEDRLARAGRVPADIKGMKIRTVGSEADMFKVMGASPINVTNGSEAFFSAWTNITRRFGSPFACAVRI